MSRYGKKAQDTVEEAMHKMKRGDLKSGKSNKTVKSRKQAIAIGLSEARAKGAKVPPSPKARKTSAKKVAAKKKKVAAKRKHVAAKRRSTKSARKKAA